MVEGNGYRKDIDGLRAIAILLVLGFHAYPDRVKAGFIGVDVFFVISGFLISSIVFNGLERRGFGVVDFYFRRIRRLFPALIVVLVSSVAFGWFALFPGEYEQLGKHVFSGALYISNFTLWSESGYFDNANYTKPLLHLWSLAIEEQFYLAYPAALLLVWKVRLRPLIAIGVLAMASFWYGMVLLETSVTAAFYSPASRCWELMVGALAACLIRLPRATPIWTDQPALTNIFSVAGALLILAASLTLNKSTPFPGVPALAPTIGAGLLILSGPSAWINRYLLSMPIPVWIGLISYPLYLWHWPLLSFAYIVESGVPSFAVRTVAVGLAFGLAWLTFRYVEKPFRYGSLKQASPPWLLLALCLIGVIGLVLEKQSGVESRQIVREYKDNRSELMRTPMRDEACLRYIKNAIPLFDYCRHSGTAFNQTVALIGDSHAHAAFPGFSSVLSQRKTNAVVFANSSCPPFLGGEHGANEYEKKHCASRAQQIIDTVIGRGDITDVYLFSRGAVYLTGREFREEMQRPGLMIGADTFAASLQESVNRLVASGKRVFYVVENPEMHLDPARCFARPFRLTHESCRLDKGVVLERQAEYLKVVSSLKNVTTLHVLDAFCPNQHCEFLSRDGTLLYADRDHLSTEGSRVLARHILAIEE